MSRYLAQCLVGSIFFLFDKNITVVLNGTSCSDGPLTRAPLSALPNSTLVGEEVLPLFGKTTRWSGAYGGYNYGLWASSDRSPIVFAIENAYIRIYFDRYASATQNLLSKEVFEPACRM
jgi:hypothetical protein